jgi:hypothetical protein
MRDFLSDEDSHEWEDLEMDFSLPFVVVDFSASGDCAWSLPDLSLESLGLDD